ncbi:MAG: hypothetical protein ABIP64_02140 [Burkholderiales bacterium]
MSKSFLPLLLASRHADRGSLGFSAFSANLPFAHATLASFSVLATEL